MNMYTNTKKSKKFILVLVLLMLFSFCYPKQVKAAWDFGENISSFFFMVERGLINFLNDIFCDEDNEYKFLDKDNEPKFTAENIIKGRFILFDANIFKEIDIEAKDSEGNFLYYDRFEWLVGSDKIENTPGDNYEGGKVTLRNTISGWYYSLRNFAIVALLSVLVYVGIRMVTSTISQDKAKYKIMFKDWIVALCLLVVMHYIMIGVLNVTSEITKAIGIDGGGGSQIGYIMSTISEINSGEANKCTENDTEDCRGHDEDGKCYVIGDAFAYEILLLAIILITVVFAWKYLKREFTIIFLILLGPISCITYPIDKISDGKAQAFNKWLTEFIYNVLVQPFHLLLYTVLCGSAVELAHENILYGLACLAMLIPAEKFVKEMFGFKDKLGSPLGAMATGAVGSQLLNKIKGGSSGKSSGGSGGSDNNTSTPDRVKNRDIDPSVLTEGGNNPPIGTPETETPEPIDTKDTTETEMPEQIDTKDTTETEESGKIDTKDETETEESGKIDTKDETETGEPGKIDTKDETETGEPGKIDTKDETESDEPEKSDTKHESEADKPEKEIPKKEQDNKPKRDIKGIANTLINRHSLRAAKKWGTADRKERWKRRVKKGAKIGLKVAGGAAGATVGAAVGLLSGKGIAAGAAAGAALGGRAYNAAEKVGTIVGDYRDAFRSPEQRQEHAEKLALNDFMTNQKQSDTAILNFREKNGRDPSQRELEQEMKDRYALSRRGITADETDDVISDYQFMQIELMERQALEDQVKEKGVNIEELKKEAGGDNEKYRELLEKKGGDLSKLKKEAGGPDKLDNTKYRKLLEDKLGNEKVAWAEHVAGNQARYTANLGRSYSGKDFRDEGAMKKAYESIYKALRGDEKNPKCSEEEADKKAREYLTRAAAIKSVGANEVALPPVKQKITLPSSGNMYGKLKFGNDATSESQKSQVKAIQDVLVEVGFDDKKIEKVMSYSTGNNNEEIIESFATNVKYIISNGVKENAHIPTGEIQSGTMRSKVIKNESVMVENLEKLGIEKTMGVTDEKVKSNIRELEKKEGTTKYREIAAKGLNGELSRNDKNNLSEKNLEMISKYKSAANGGKKK